MAAVLNIIAAVAALVGSLGIAYAVFTSAKVKQTIELYEKETTAQGKRIATLEHEQVAAAEQIGSLKRENDVLRDLATGKSLIEALAVEVKLQESQRHAEHAGMMELLGEMKDSLAEVWRAVARSLGSP